MNKPRILIAGVGNELRQDDAFGLELLRQWTAMARIPAQVQTMEVGIGGIHLVQELHSGYDILVLLDALNYEAPAGKVFFRELESVSDINLMPLDEKRAFLADMHYTDPLRALMLAKALNVLPNKVFILGCQSAQHDDFAIGMSEPVTAAIPRAIDRLESWLTSILGQESH